MAELRDISLEELKEILKEHRKWVESDRREGKKATLFRANLWDTNLGKANLQEADLHRANL